MAGNLTVGLALNWPRVGGLSTYGLKAEVRDISTRLYVPYGVPVRHRLPASSVQRYS